MMDQMKAWFSGLSSREQLMVAVCAAFVVAALVWLLAIKPLYDAKEAAALRVADKAMLLGELQAQAGSMPASGAAPVQGLDQSLVVVIDRTTRLRSLDGYLKRNQPDGNNSVRLRFENAPFDDLVTWMSELRKSYGLRAVSATFDPAGANGRINCNLVLNRSAL